MSKIIIVSLHRTATQSVSEYLYDLGYSVLHWGGNLFQKTGIYNTFEKMVEDTAHNYDVYADVPFNVMYEFFDKKYPNSKFIMIERDFESWKKSVRKLYDKINKNYFDPYESYQYFKYIKKRKYIFKKVKGINEVSDKDLLKIYSKHIESVKKYFNGTDKLLVLNINDKYIGEKISNFLNNPVIKDFPNIDFLKEYT